MKTKSKTREFLEFAGMVAAVIAIGVVANIASAAPVI